MISRLLLVGMVGVLGISLPDGADLGWSSTWARTDATACARPRETGTFEPIAVDRVSIHRIADEPNRQSEGPDLPMVSTTQVAAKARPVAAEPVDVVDRMFAENSVWGEPAAEAVARSLPVDVVGEMFAENRIWSEPATETVATALPVDAVDEMFAENRVWGEPATEAVATALPVDAVDEMFAENRVWGEPATEAVARSLPVDVVDEIFAENRVWSEPAAEAVATVLPPVPAPRPSLEPIAAAEGPPSIADELNRASDGLTVVRDARPTIGTALGLTRDAALAWMNVLTKIVTAPQAVR